MGWGIWTAICVIALVIGRVVQMTARSPGQLANADRRRVAKQRLLTGFRELKDGEAISLVGVVVAGETLLDAPLSDKSCVFWAAHARMWATVGRKSTLYAEAGASRVVAFRLETEHGIVEVEGERAETELPMRAVIPRNLDRERAFLTANGLEARLIREASLEEAIVAPGDRVSVYGVVQIERVLPGDAGYRDEGIRLHLIDHPSHRLTLGKAR